MSDAAALDATRADALAAIAAAATLADLKAAELTVLGKRGSITELNKRLGALAPDERRSVGARVNAIRDEALAAIDARRSALDADARRAALAADRLDLTETTSTAGVGTSTHGRPHLIAATIEELEDIFVGMGFEVFHGPEVETDWYNFEALNFQKGHPARSMHDTLQVALGEQRGDVVMRTHTSPMQLHVMETRKPPIYAVMPGRCYRRDTPDARHLHTFHQLEAIVIDRGISLGHLAATIDAFIRAYFGRDDLHTRLRPGFFPFTEPSAEFEITCPFCGGSGCRVCSGTGWIELGGCGMVHPNVLRNGGIDPEEWTGFAWGFGIDRLAMNKHAIADLRDFLDNDVRFLRQF